VAPWWWFLCKPKHVGAASIILICFNNSTFFYVVCISWIIKWLILLMHVYNHEDGRIMKTSQFTKLDSRHWNMSNIFAVCHWINPWHTAATISDFSFAMPSNFIPAPYLSFIWRSFTSWLWRHCFGHIMLYISAAPVEGAAASRSILIFSNSMISLSSSNTVIVFRIPLMKWMWVLLP